MILSFYRLVLDSTASVFYRTNQFFNLYTYEQPFLSKDITLNYKWKLALQVEQRAGKESQYHVGVSTGEVLDNLGIVK